MGKRQEGLDRRSGSCVDFWSVMDTELHVMDLGRCAYGPALVLQDRLVAQRKNDEIPDTLVLVEHEPVYTLGRNAEKADVLATEQELAAAGIDVFRTGRGGKATYHGPGQLVGYPIIRLTPRFGGVLEYVAALECVIIAVLGQYGVSGATDPENRGVWVGDDKIAALGIRVTRGITMHGFALNVCPNMDHYRGIVPCGIRDKGVTSLVQLAPRADMANVGEKVVSAVVEVFGYTGISG